MSAKNRVLSKSQEFKLMRSEYELRVNQLERDVYECCKILNKVRKTKELNNNCSSAKNGCEKEKFVSWEFDMRDFPVENIAIQLRDKIVYLRAFKKNLVMKQEILLPQNVDKSKVTAILTASGNLTISVPIITAIR
ncbi:uncharacterized protein LOC119548294 [Drosophila subpulchrella]|uniref:uncharacterized protein LOC119548294 n=1 Tax=Drosophila subpulchrella TaxID=1486046 RepID=UPI0018A13239|nr:uncharacterized protein LOC119548294 [Drosophila subpulchrella]